MVQTVVEMGVDKRLFLGGLALTEVGQIFETFTAAAVVDGFDEFAEGGGIEDFGILPPVYPIFCTAICSEHCGIHLFVPTQQVGVCF